MAPLNPLHPQGDRDLRMIANRLSYALGRDALVQQTTSHLRESFQVDRVMLYYFYRRWKGQVTFESVGDPTLSLLGSSGPDQCFNDEYAALYEAGRIKAIADITTEPITSCHREFLQALGVRANLVAPILTERGLWGLLIAHHCQSTRPWTDADIALIRASAVTLTGASALYGA
ncbi:MAG TPA: GAF domain-containing protein [Chroococcidiopsis sp.]